MFNYVGKYVCFCICIALSLSACQPKVPKDALMFTPETLQDRQLQTRRFDTNDEAKILSACAALLQDFGFKLEESETKLGVLVGTKDRSAVHAGQIVGAMLVAAFTGVVVPTDSKQKMRACVVTKPVGEDMDSIAVRVTFQRIVWNSEGQISRLEALKVPEQYQEFFVKLSKAVFLEAHEI